MKDPKIATELIGPNGSTYPGGLLRSAHESVAASKNSVPIRIIQLLLLSAVTCLLFYLVHHSSERLEDMVLGNWEEKVWRYEKANKKGNYLLSKKTIDEEVVDLISKDLLIHQTEYWLFHPNGQLKLKKKGGEAVFVEWRLKGRGNLLKLKYNNSVTEYYQVVHVAADKMVLYFENDVHTRGIVKIEFRKI